MNSTSKRILEVLVGVVAVGVLFGVVVLFSQPKKPEDVAKAAFECLQKGDVVALQKYCTPKAADRIAGTINRSPQALEARKQQLAGTTVIVENVKVEDDRAVVALVVKSEKGSERQELQLREGKSGWLIEDSGETSETVPTNETNTGLQTGQEPRQAVARTKSAGWLIEEERPISERTSQTLGIPQSTARVMVGPKPDQGARVLTTSTEDADLIAYYPFDNSAKDSCGKHHGIGEFITTTTDRKERADSAFLFNGTSSGVSVPDARSLRLASTDFTITAWVYETERNADYGDTIMSKRKPESDCDGWTLGIEGNKAEFTGKLRFQLSGGTNPKAISSNEITLNQWHHIAVVYRERMKSLQFYIDGFPSGVTQDMPSPNPTTTQPLSIGRDPLSSGEYQYHFHGKIDEIRIYNRALEANDILVKFNAP